MSKDAHLYNLIQAFEQPGCALCRICEDTGDKFVDAVLWELVNNIKVRDEINSARGYCRDHAWLANRSGGALGAAIMNQGVLRTVMRVIDANDVTNESPSKMRQLFGKRASDPVTGKLHKELSPQIECPVCVHVKDIEGHYMTVLLKNMVIDEELNTVFRSSQGICLEHLRKVTEQATAGPELGAIMAAQRVVWQTLYDELEEFIRKNDHRFRHEKFGVEQDSWRRAITVLAGPLPGSENRQRGLSQPKRSDIKK